MNADPRSRSQRSPAELSADELSPAELDLLVDVATRAVRLAVMDGWSWRPDPADYPPALRRPGAAFVTLELDGALMGCIGTLSAQQPLVVTVADRARAAALADPRVGPVRPADLADLDVAVSVLSPPEPIAVDDYEELVAALRPGVDGLIIDSDRYRATFLPSVWETVPEPSAFVAALWRKAGIPPRAWPRGARPGRYTAQHRQHRIPGPRT
jgi:hypothetical protein